jgi:hypothetical protein
MKAMFGFVEMIAASLGKSVMTTGIVLAMLLICLSALLFTLAVGAPLRRKAPRHVRRPGYPDTRALLRR